MRTPHLWHPPDVPFTAADVGKTRNVLQRAVNDGRLIRLRPGIYVATQAWQQDPTEQHLLRAMAAIRSRPHLIAARNTAALAHGLALADPHAAQSAPSFLVNGDRYRSEPSEGIACGRFAAHDVVEVRAGLTVTSVACTAVDIAGMASLPHALVAVDSAVRLLAARVHGKARLRTAPARVQAAAVAELTEALDRVGGAGYGRLAACLRRPARLAPLLVGAPSHGVYPGGMQEEFDLITGDGTRLTAWRNGTVDGAPVLVCNGMGVPPEAWPRLLADDCEYSVAGWNHRGALGSDRPADPTRIDITDHADDAVALMDALGWDKAVVVAWSLGVNVAFELAAQHPDRVAGLLSVAGVPGGTFDTLFAPQLVPRPLRKPMGVSVARAGRALGGQLNFLARTVPTGRPFAEWLRHTGFILPFADPADISAWASSMKQQDFRWYFELALALSRHDYVDPSFVKCPVTIVSGAIDMLTSQSDVLKYAEQIPHAEVHSLPGTHCLPLEFPDRIMDMLRDLYARAEWEATLAEARAEAGIADADDDGYLEDLTLDEELLELRDPDFVR